MPHCSWHMRSPSPSGSAHRALPTNSSACPRARGVPPWLYPPPPQRECGLVCFFHVSGSRDSLPSLRQRTDLRRLWRPLGPRTSARSLLGLHRGDRATMPSSPLTGMGWRAGSGWQSGPSPPAPSQLHLSAPSARRPGTLPLLSLGGLSGSRHGGQQAGDIPFALTEPVSTEASRTRAEKAGPPEPSRRDLERPGRGAGTGDGCVTRGAGPPRAEAGAGSGRGARSGEWGLAAARAWETVSEVPVPRWRRRGRVGGVGAPGAGTQAPGSISA